VNVQSVNRSGGGGGGEDGDEDRPVQLKPPAIISKSVSLVVSCTVCVKCCFLQKNRVRV